MASQSRSREETLCHVALQTRRAPSCLQVAKFKFSSVLAQPRSADSFGALVLMERVCGLDLPWLAALLVGWSMATTALLQNTMASLWKHTYNSFFPGNNDSLDTDTAFNQTRYDSHRDFNANLSSNNYNNSSSRSSLLNDMNYTSTQRGKASARPLDFNTSADDAPEAALLDSIISHIETNNKIIDQLGYAIDNLNLVDDIKQLESLKDLQKKYNELLLQHTKLSAEAQKDRSASKKTLDSFNRLIKEHQDLKTEFEDMKINRKDAVVLKDKIYALERDLRKEKTANRENITAKQVLETENKRLTQQRIRDREEIERLKKQLQVKENSQLESKRNDFTRSRFAADQLDSRQVPKQSKATTPLLNVSSTTLNSSSIPVSPLKNRVRPKIDLEPLPLTSRTSFRPALDDDTIENVKRQYQTIRQATH